MSASATTAPINDRREIFGWMMYDWGNSAFSTTVVTALLGPYLTSLAGGLETEILGINPAALYPYSVSLSVFLQVLILPLIGTAADYTPNKKRLMLNFAYAGAFATILLFFIRADMPMFGTAGAVLLGCLLFIIANLSFGAAVVAYNSYLPEIASPDKRDEISSKGWAAGYIGGGLLLAVNLGMITLMSDTGLAVRLSIASAGVWWLVFTWLYPHKRLVQRPSTLSLPAGESIWTYGFKKVFITLRHMTKNLPQTGRYLLSYLIYNDGIQTIIAVSTVFAASELGTAPETLLLLVLMIQFVAFGGALLFGWMASRIGAKMSILIGLVVWAGLAIYAYGFLYNDTQLFIMGAILGLVMGGTQALSRSLFSQMIPPDNEAEYFGFYEISERGTSWLGPLLFGLAVDFTGSQRIAILSLIAFFIIGIILLIPVNVRKAMVDSGNSPEGVVI